MNAFQGWLKRIFNRAAHTTSTIALRDETPLPREVRNEDLRTDEEIRRDQAMAVLSTARSTGDWCALSRHRNGFVREAAVRRLMQIEGRYALAALIDSLNDYVPQIRTLASDHVQRFLDPQHAVMLIQVLDSFISLAQKNRIDHQSTLTNVIRILATPSVRDTTLEAFKATHGKPARLLLEILEKAFAHDLAHMLEIALNHQDPSVQRLALQASLQLPDAQVQALLLGALTSHAANLRVNALRAWLNLANTPDQIHCVLKRALFDTSTSVRSLARWASSKWQLDCREVLLQRLQAPLPTTQREWIGLIGLVRELNEPQAREMLESAVEYSAPRVRAQALETFEQVCGEASLPALIRALGDPSPRVFRVAVDVLRKQSSTAVDGPVSDLLESGSRTLSHEHRRALVSIKASWEQLNYWMRGLSQADTDNGDWLAEINRWCETRHKTSDYTTPKALRLQLLHALGELESQGKVAGGTVASLR
ncbi:MULTISPECIES: HEAT repeat domain-containing protein [unclassified Pseudomonas]|uniref:HEAT repeat domain-containing protein n=1 Tax=unclassified Pseudomonas TaxID=196821 RepID=UPI000CD273E4|nr:MULTISPECIES: HEAT repeat domain-containing protein [unclassified Pseudomonas]POA31408.1 PBS lyase [Pseudomonas sp. GW456-R21]POA63100.1 PBS lyase [Pseudomonas sp. GW460-R15]